MASGAIKGITVEIGGDTTKLGKAIGDTEKKSRSLQVELRQVEKLLKFDPTNTELLTQKQNILADSILATSKKLDTLKEAEAQVIAQFERGEVAEEQVRALQREIIQTEQTLNSMRSELQTATRNLEEFGDNNGVAREETARLEREIREQNEALEAEKRVLQEAEKAQKEHEQAVKEAKEELADFGEKASEAFDKIKTGVAVLGGATLAGAGYALNLSTEFDKAFNTLVTKTGASTEEMDELNESMERVYANNFGESIEDVAEAMATVKTSTNLTGKELEKVTENALLMRDTFGFEVNESIRAVNSMMDQFGISADEAYNLLAQGAQKGLNQNDDLLDTINEYSVHFERAGYSADDMFNMLANGVETGTWSVDKLGDAVKEFNIRMSDGSAKDAVEALGFSWESVSKSWSKGGDEAKDVFNMLFNELDGLENTTEGYSIGVGLLGTMYEDLGQDAVLALSQTEGEISKTSDALQKINETKYDDIGSAIQGLGRTLETDLVKPLGEEFKPYVEDAIEYVKANGPQIKEVIANIVTKVGEFVGFIVDNGPTILSVIAGIGAGFAVWNVVQTIVGVVSAIKAFTTATEGASLAMKIFNAIGKTNVFILIASVIATVIVAIVTFIATNEDARAKFVEIWNKIKEVCSNVIKAIVNFFTVTIPNAFNNFKTVLGNIVNSIVNFFTVTIPNAWKSFLTTVSNFISSVVTYFSQLPGKIWTWLSNMITKVKTWATNTRTTMINCAKNVINSVINFFSQLPYKIGYALGFVIGKLILFGKNALNWVKTNVPKIINNVVTFFSQLPGKIWTFLVNIVQKIGTWCTNMKTKATSGVKSLISSVVSFMRELPGKIWSAIVGAVNRVATWGSNMKNKASSAIKNLVSSVVSTAKSLPGKIWSAISGAIGKMSAWGSQMLTKAKTGIKNVANAITNGLKSVPGKMASIGKNIVQGIWNGIKNATSWIKDKVKSFAKGVVGGIKDALGIKSPSRVMRDQVGKYIAEGIGVGIAENEDSPIDALEKLSNDMSEQDFDFNGATINRKLTTTFTNGATSNPIADNTALLSKLDGIYERLARLQIVLDTGTLVGETIDKIDAGLATKQLLSARGV